MVENVCVFCGTPNAPKRTECAACGRSLPRAQQPSGTRILRVARSAPEPPCAVLSLQATSLCLTGRTAEYSVEVVFDHECVFGRAGEGIVPDVDLTPYNAMTLGVSRRHLKLLRQGEGVFVQDLGGINGSFLNRQRLLPHEPHTLQDGDQLALGQLVLTVSFGDRSPQEREAASGP